MTAMRLCELFALFFYPFVFPLIKGKIFYSGSQSVKPPESGGQERWASGSDIEELDKPNQR